MKITKRGEFVLAVGVLSLAALVVFGICEAVSFVTSHHRENYKCHQIIEGWECSTRWVQNQGATK
jgi:hypothetical protein